jgi:hypothetical protein
MVVFLEMQIFFFGLNGEDHHEEVNYPAEEQDKKKEEKKLKQGYVESPNKHTCIYYIDGGGQEDLLPVLLPTRRGYRE